MCAVPSARYVPLYRGFVPQLASSMTASHHWVERGRRPLLMIHSYPVQSSPGPADANTRKRMPLAIKQRSKRPKHRFPGDEAPRQGANPPYLVASPIYPSMEHGVPYPKHRFLDGPLLLANPISLSPSVRFVASGMALGWTLSQASLASSHYYSHSHCFLFSSTYLLYIPASHR